MAIEDFEISGKLGHIGFSGVANPLLKACRRLRESLRIPDEGAGEVNTSIGISCTQLCPPDRQVILQGLCADHGLAVSGDQPAAAHRRARNSPRGVLPAKPRKGLGLGTE